MAAPRRNTRKVTPVAATTRDPAAPRRCVVLIAFANESELHRRVEVGETVTLSWGLAAHLRQRGFVRYS